jgi:tyrosyl-tRNA synthetase
MKVDCQDVLTQVQRGVVDTFPEGELAKKLEKSRKEGRPLKVKLGVDPTGTDLHLGHIVPLLKLKQFQDLGHQALLIIGDYTATVGDPSGRNKARPQLTHEQVMANCKTYTEQVFKIIDRERTQVVYNGTWFSKMGFSDVINLLSNMTLARMLEREDFAHRFQNQLPISLHELAYPLMQGYDSAMIQADIELGGTDQKFNILVGRELQKDLGQEPQVGLCVPILLGTDGKEKMSKSLGNYIALDDPPEEKFGKIMSIPDELMPMYFELLTDVPLDELDRMQQEVQAGTLHPAKLKRRLARDIVARFDGEDAAVSAEQHFDLVFVDKDVPDDVMEISFSRAQLEDNRIWIIKLITEAGFAGTNSEARRLVSQNAVRIDDEPITNPDLDWEVQDGALLKVGKRSFARICLVD